MILKSEIEYHYDDDDVYNKAIDSFFIEPKKRYIIDESKNKEEYEKINKQLEKLTKKVLELWKNLKEEKMLEKMKEISELLNKGADCNYLFRGLNIAKSIMLSLNEELLSFFIKNGLDLNTTVMSVTSDIPFTLLHYFVMLIPKDIRDIVPKSLKIFKIMIEGGASLYIRGGDKNKTVMEILRGKSNGDIYISIIHKYKNVFSLKLRILIEIVKGKLTIPANYPRVLLNIDRGILIRNLKKYRKKMEDS